MLDLADADADREEGNARRMAWIDTSAGVRFTHGSHRDDVIARLDADPALRRSLHRRAFLALTERVRARSTPTPASPSASRGTPSAPTVTCPPPRRPAPSSPPPAPSGRAARPPRRGPGPGSPGTRPDPGTRASLHLALGDALDQRGADTEADREYQLAYDIAAGRPLDRAEALIRLARRWTDPGKIDWYLLHGLRDGIAALGEDAHAQAEGQAADALRAAAHRPPGPQVHPGDPGARHRGRRHQAGGRAPRRTPRSPR